MAKLRCYFKLFNTIYRSGLRHFIGILKQYKPPAIIFNQKVKEGHGSQEDLEIIGPKRCRIIQIFTQTSGQILLTGQYLKIGCHKTASEAVLSIRPIGTKGVNIKGHYLPSKVSLTPANLQPFHIKSPHSVGNLERPLFKVHLASDPDQSKKSAWSLYGCLVVFTERSQPFELIELVAKCLTQFNPFSWRY